MALTKGRFPKAFGSIARSIPTGMEKNGTISGRAYAPEQTP